MLVMTMALANLWNRLNVATQRVTGEGSASAAASTPAYPSPASRRSRP